MRRKRARAGVVSTDFKTAQNVIRTRCDTIRFVLRFASFAAMKIDLQLQLQYTRRKTTSRRQTVPFHLYLLLQSSYTNISELLPSIFSSHPIMSPQSRLIPIRIDAWAADKSTRLVDTILFDPTCWPVTKHTSDPSVWIEETTQCLVDTALLDVDVMGMERERTAPSSLASAPNNNKFVGRLDVWNFSLQQRLCDQVNIDN